MFVLVCGNKNGESLWLHLKEGEVVLYRIFWAEFPQLFRKFDNRFFVVGFAFQQPEFSRCSCDADIQGDVQRLCLDTVPDS